MIDLMHGALAVAGLVITVLRAWQLRARDPMITSLWVTLLFLSLGEGIQVGSIFALTGDHLGRPGAGLVVMSGLVIGASTACRRFAYSIQHARSPGSWLRISAPGALAWAVIVVLFWADAPRALPHELLHRGFWYDESLNCALIWWLTLGYLGWALVVSFVALRTYARLSPPGPLRSGLTLGASGIAVGFLFVETQAAMAGLWLAGHGRALVPLDAELNAAILTISLALIGTGTVFPPLVSRAVPARRAVQQRRALRHLRPLADYLRRVAPDKAFDLTPADRTQRLIATGTSIRDRQRHLRHYVTPDLQRRAHEHAQRLERSPANARAVAEAAWLEVAARAKLRGEPAHTALYDPPSADQSLDDEIASLTRLARAHRSDPKVAALVSALENRV